MTETYNQAQFVADKFGGIASMARQTGIAYHLIRDWCVRTTWVPERERAKILEAAALHDIRLTRYDFIQHLPG